MPIYELVLRGLLIVLTLGTKGTQALLYIQISTSLLEPSTNPGGLNYTQRTVRKASHRLTLRKKLETSWGGAHKPTPID